MGIGGLIYIIVAGIVFGILGYVANELNGASLAFLLLLAFSLEEWPLTLNGLTPKVVGSITRKHGKGTTSFSRSRQIRTLPRLPSCLTPRKPLWYRSILLYS